MEDKELILKLQALKQIKPRQEWVVLAKSEIFKQGNFERGFVRKPSYKVLLPNMMNFFFSRKLAYAFAVVVLLVFVGIGAIGFMNYGSHDKVAVQENSTASLIAVRSSVETLRVKSQNLAQATKDKSENVPVAIKEVNDAAKELANTIKEDPKLAKEVALDINNNITYLDIVGVDGLNEVSDMYKTVVTQLLEDLHQRSLPLDQKEELDRIEAALSKSGDYVTALRDILLLSRIGAINN